MKYILLLLASMVLPAAAQQKILPLSEGLTLAEVEFQGQPQTIAVLSDNQRTIKGVNLSQILAKNLPPVALYHQLGYAPLLALIQQTAQADYQSFSYAELKSPAGRGEFHLALGFNYAAHAREIEQNETPFMFMKLSLPTREQPIANQPQRLLDYEVEICARSLQDIDQPIDSSAPFAYFLCGDFTDRALLLRNMDRQNLQSGKGFSESKSLAGYFPTGPYMIIPNTPRTLHSIQLSLSRNGELKQQAAASQMIWDIPVFVNTLLAYQRSHTPPPVAQQHSWLPADKLTPANSLLTGTPAGVLMQPPNGWFKFTQAMQYFFTAIWWQGTYQSVSDYVVEQYLQQAFSQQRFLQQGEQIEMSATYLGQLSIMIE